MFDVMHTFQIFIALLNYSLSTCHLVLIFLSNCVTNRPKMDDVDDFAVEDTVTHVQPLRTPPIKVTVSRQFLDRQFLDRQFLNRQFLGRQILDPCMTNMSHFLPINALYGYLPFRRFPIRWFLVRQLVFYRFSVDPIIRVLGTSLDPIIRVRHRLLLGLWLSVKRLIQVIYGSRICPSRNWRSRNWWSRKCHITKGQGSVNNGITFTSISCTSHLDTDNVFCCWHIHSKDTAVDYNLWTGQCHHKGGLNHWFASSNESAISVGTASCFTYQRVHKKIE